MRERTVMIIATFLCAFYFYNVFAPESWWNPFTKKDEIIIPSNPQEGTPEMGSTIYVIIMMIVGAIYIIYYWLK